MKNKYKLIKEYPGSPELGTIAEKARDIKYTYPDGRGSLSSSAVECLFEKLIVNQPEYWEEVVEKDYEILSYYAKNISGKGDNHVDPDYIWYETYKGNGQWSRKGHITKPYTSEEIIRHHGYGIHSVKRLSDDQVFQINDSIKDGKIKSIIIKNEKVYLEI